MEKVPNIRIPKGQIKMGNLMATQRKKENCRKEQSLLLKRRLRSLLTHHPKCRNFQKKIINIHEIQLAYRQHEISHSLNTRLTTSKHHQITWKIHTLSNINEYFHYSKRYFH